jgi:3-deoxy-D-manno-octulosonic-acid transferase
VWLHGASVGETLSILPLLERLRAARPDATLLVTSGTVTSAQLLARRLPEGVLHQYLPVDAPGPARLFMAHWRPDLAVLVESELWPNLLTEARAGGARLALVSARLSEASFRGWSKTPATAGQLLAGFDLVLAQDDETAARLSSLGARDDGRLNLKLVGEALPVEPAALAEVQDALAGRPVLLAASTHPGEEAIVLAAFQPLRDRPDRPLMVIAPRHPIRGPEVATLAGAGLRSRGDRLTGPVHVADTLGELGLWLRLSRAVFVGGSLVEGVGGHNPLEPARLDCALASGPQVENWRGVYDGLNRAGGLRWVQAAAGLTAFWTQALDGDPALGRQAAQARDFAQGWTGALDDAARRLLALLP